MSNGTLELELVVDIPAGQLQQVVQDFEAEGYTVQTQQQNSGAFAIAAAKSS